MGVDHMEVGFMRVDLMGVNQIHQPSRSHVTAAR